MPKYTGISIIPANSFCVLSVVQVLPDNVLDGMPNWNNHHLFAVVLCSPPSSKTTFQGKDEPPVTTIVNDKRRSA